MLFRAGIPYVWAATGAELRAYYGCDELMPHAPGRLVRATSSTAPSASVFRRLCQLRIAPYSYDWLDNLGRQSPRALVPGLADLAVGQPVMTIFTLASFTRDEHLTLRLNPGAPTTLFGAFAVTYAVRPIPGGSRLVAVLRWHGGDGVPGAVRKALLPWGDLLMMRRQLRTLARLAEAADVAGDGSASYPDDDGAHDNVGDGLAFRREQR